MQFTPTSAVFIALYLLLTPLAAPPLAAQTAHQSGAAQTKQALHKTAIYDWFANRPTPTATPTATPAPRVAKARYFGSGAYICSPAGFGNKSRCRKR